MILAIFRVARLLRGLHLLLWLWGVISAPIARSLLFATIFDRIFDVVRLTRHGWSLTHPLLKLPLCKFQDMWLIETWSYDFLLSVESHGWSVRGQIFLIFFRFSIWIMLALVLAKEWLHHILAVVNETVPLPLLRTCRPMGFKMSVMSTDLVWIRPLHGRLIVMRFWTSTMAAILPFLLAEGLPWRLRLSSILAPFRVKRVLIHWWWLHVKALILCYRVMKWLLFLRSTALKCSLISMNFKSTIDDMVIVAPLTAQIRLRIDGTLRTNRVSIVHVLVSGGQFLARLFIFF